MSVSWFWPDWNAVRCSDPPAESCSDAGCPIHGDDAQPWQEDDGD